MLPEPKPHILSHHFDLALQNFFQKTEDEAVSGPLYAYPFERTEFYQLLNRSLLKVLKRQLKKIEELINFLTRNNDQAEFNRIKLDKIFKECFRNIEQSANFIHDFVIDMEAEHQWDCNCMKQVCEQRQSCEQFVQDIFSFLARSSQPINKEMKSAVQRKLVLHSLIPNDDSINNKEWTFGNRAGQLILQIENSCQKVKKAKKRKRNKKTKEKPQQQMKPVEEPKENEEDQKQLTAFLGELEIDLNDRQNCIVSQQWLSKVAQRTATKRKH